MHLHARPHLEIHSRSKGHSAVAGCAYRLGILLYDEKAKVWHDFRKRELGEEIVRALTVAPAGAPWWATDPQQLWNRVEASEKRKDAQVARDYRIPIPFGLSDEDAGTLAEEMARFISDELHTPVSIGLHRDADRDALGNLKPVDKQGFHAHLYFPSRRLLDVVEGGEGDSGDVSTSFFAKKESQKYFGEKISVLSNRTEGAVFIELLNCKWSELANDFSRKNGSDLKFEYKSYKRLSVNVTPQPTLGRSATAMERRGIYTNRGDSLREALAIAQVYQQAQATALDAQHHQALEDVRREKAGQPTPQEQKPPVKLPMKPASSSKTTSTVKKSISIFGRKVGPTEIFMPMQGSLAYRLRASAPTPSSKEERDELDRSLVLIEALDKALAVFHQIMKKMEEVLAFIQTLRASKLEAEFQTDESRKRRRIAHIRLNRWEDEHRWRIKAFANFGGLPLPEHQKLRSEVALHNQHVQDFKRTIESLLDEVKESQGEVDDLQVKRDEALTEIRRVVVALDDAKSPLMGEVLKALPEPDRQLLRDELPTLFQREGDDSEMVLEAFSKPEPTPCPEPARHKEGLKW